VVLDISGEESRIIPNDYVWVFAGGKPPNEFLRKVGVGFGPQEDVSPQLENVDDVKTVSLG